MVNTSSMLKFNAILLGCAQDSGIPSIGCSCSRCLLARGKNVYNDGMVSCLGLVDEVDGKAFLIGATPNISTQLWELQESIEPLESNLEVTLGGILLTHGSMGHCTGLLHLGKEGLDSRNIPVFCTKSVGSFLRSNLPWSLLVDRKNISIVELAVGSAHKLSKSITVLPISVPQSGEITSTVAYSLGINGKGKLLYCPCTGSWDGWGKDICDWCNDVDVALLDGTYFSADELPGGVAQEVSHPFLKDSIKILQSARSEIVFTHINHTNPVLRTNSSALQHLKNHNMKVAEFGMQWCFTGSAIEKAVPEKSESVRKKTEERTETIVEWDAAVEQCGGDEDFLMELLVDLWNEIRDHLEELSRIIPEGAIEQSGRIGHAIKGASSNLMCHRLRDAALAMERVGRAVATNTKPITELQVDLEATFVVLKEEVGKYETFLKSINLI